MFRVAISVQFLTILTASRRFTVCLSTMFHDRGLVRSGKQRAIFSEFICELPSIAGTKCSNNWKRKKNERKKPEPHPPLTDQIRRKHGNISSNRIKIERKNKMYATQNLVALLKAQGVSIGDIEAALQKPLPFSAFDNVEYNHFPAEEMLGVPGHEASIPARVSAQIYVTESDAVGDRCGEWLNGVVIHFDRERELFACEVRLPLPKDEAQLKGPSRASRDSDGKAVVSLARPRILLCFDGEDPFVYALRVAACLKSQRQSEMRMLYNLYVDCMPTDEMASLDGEQIGRISALAVNTRKLQHHVMAEDTAKIMQDVGMDYVRTMNKARQKLKSCGEGFYYTPCVC